MEAGRELDALVAEHVMGWQREKRHYTYVGDRMILKPPVEPEKKVGYGYRYGIHIKGLWVAHQMPEFSTNIADAWTAAEALRSRGLFVRVLLGKRFYTCAIHNMEHGGDSWTAVEETAPLAICKAALASVLRAAGGEEDAPH